MVAHTPLLLPSVGCSQNPTMRKQSSNTSVISGRSSSSRWKAQYGTLPPPHKLVLCVSDTIGTVRSYILHKQAEEKDISTTGGKVMYYNMSNTLLNYVVLFSPLTFCTQCYRCLFTLYHLILFSFMSY